MISIQAKIILGAVAFAIVASALTIWLILAWGNGAFAMVVPLALAGALALVVYSVVFKGKGGPS
ncbi:hypothetical protein KUL25_06555 [Rhodobacteraceae bacterium N5(2021)]|uniref:Uncharacterized protein n=1 Tax=Gymnodinialimonas phycosphaerae TaxID=2841589 RepID=A0A975YH57_9RHOB|nr:hypothetical protein [Gymnodinialimonas phycosphaerae]MBY4892420.1 hypothetical protein [Gymnodinialimonas phycosphaerae]